MGAPDQGGKLDEEGVQHVVVGHRIIEEEEKTLLYEMEKRVRLAVPHGLAQEVSPDEQSHCACGNEPGYILA
jgi:hypothetical protein